MVSETITVFLADDHRMVREGIGNLIDQEDDLRVVGECDNGLKALREIHRLKPRVVVLDAHMRGLNGIDICHELRRKMYAGGILMLTGSDNPELVARAMRSGATGYLLKEAGVECLAQAIRTVDRGELFLGPGLRRTAMDLMHSGPDDHYERLSTRERQVLQLIAEGHPVREIAEKLDVTSKAIYTRRTQAMAKLGIQDLASLVKFAVRKGLVP